MSDALGRFVASQRARLRRVQREALERLRLVAPIEIVGDRRGHDREARFRVRV